MTPTKPEDALVERLLDLMELLADNINEQADERRQRAINARQEKSLGLIQPDETDAWAISFSASYQVLRGIALAIDDTVEQARAALTGEAK